jgi:hypothetical protein
LITKEASQLGGFSAWAHPEIGFRGVSDCTVTPRGELYFYSYDLGHTHEFDYVFPGTMPAYTYSVTGLSPPHGFELKGGIQGVYHFDLSNNELIPINNTFIGWTYGQHAMGFEFSPWTNNFMFHDGGYYNPLINYDSYDSQMAQFQKNVNFPSDWVSFSSLGPNLFYGIFIYDTGTIKWNLYPSYTSVGFEGAPYNPQPGDGRHAPGYALSHWKDDEYLVLAHYQTPSPLALRQAPTSDVNNVRDTDFY